MKKLFLYLLIMLIMLSGCKVSDTPDNNNDNKINIITTVFPVYDFAKNICGDFADVSLLVPPGNDSHSFEPTPADIISLSKSDLFIYIGGQDEIWVEDIIKSANLSQNKMLKLEDVTGFIPFEDEHHHTEYDEHIWTSVKNASKICEAITDKVCEIDPKNLKTYKENFPAYNEKLTELDKKITDITETSLRNTIVFGDRFPFLSFTKDYGLEYYSVFHGCSAESEPSAAKIAELTDKIKKENIPVVFHIEFSNENVADILCENTGAKKLLFHSCHTVTAEDLKNGASYIGLMNENADNLKEALN